MTLYQKDALLSAVCNASKPVAFLVGSPLSAGPDGRGVPSVERMLELVGEEVDTHATASKVSYKTTLAGRTGAGAYQASLAWLQAYVNQDAVNRVVQKAVLQACISPFALRQSGRIVRDGSPEDWHIPPGMAALGNLVCTGGDRFQGPVITTNFDPLISLSIRAAGMRPDRRILDADGALPKEVEEESDSRSVVHLHGYWWGSDTLHTPDQLSAPRPKLSASLQRVLRNRVLLVVAYGGWDDVFTRALADLLNHDSAELDVIWCFHEADEALVSARYGRLLQAVAPAIARGRLRSYGGVDCHTIFSDIAAAVDSVTPAFSATSTSSLTGWSLVDSAYLSTLAPLTRGEVLLYFDGAVPTWRHAQSNWIPRRGAVADLGRGLREAAEGCSECSMHTVLAAGGEGKSTVLLQTAVDAALSGDWHVLRRPRPDVGLDPGQVVTLDGEHRWLLVADDAENLIGELFTTAEQLHTNGSANVHFLLAARDTDWRAAEGYSRPWSSLLSAAPHVMLRGLNKSDAEDIVAAWAAQGNEGLGDLVRLPEADRVSEFQQRVRREAANRGEGSFFGGLLATRFTDAKLRAHVRSLLTHLRDIDIEHSRLSLFHALLYIAACHAVGIPGIDEKVLADLVGVPRERVYSRVANPLGDEAAAVYSAGCVQTRHRRVASAVLVEAELALGEDLAEVWRDIVRQTVLTSRDVLIVHQSHGPVIHASRKLQRSLPHSIPEKRRAEIAIAAGLAATETEPSRMSYIVDLGKTFRNADMLGRAVQVFRRAVPSLDAATDHNELIRGFYYEWGVCEGGCDDEAASSAANAWVSGLSLSDHLIPAPIDRERVKLSCAGLGVAFGRLTGADAACPYALARRASAHIGRVTSPDSKTEGYFHKYDREADKVGTPRLADTKQAVDWLQDGVRAAWSRLEDDFLKGLVDPHQVTFAGLLNSLEHTDGPGSGIHGPGSPDL